MAPQFVKQIVDPSHERNIKSPVRAVIMWKSVPQKSIHRSSGLSAVTPCGLTIIGVIVTLRW